MRSVICSRILIIPLLLWFVVLLFAAHYLSSRASVSGTQDDDDDPGVDVRLDQAFAQMLKLQKHNQELRTLLDEMKYVSPGQDSNKIDEIISRAQHLEVENNNDISSKFVPKSNPPDTKYELLRQRLNNDVREFWFYISAQLNHLKKDAKKNSPDLDGKLNEMLNVANQHKLSLTKDLATLDKVDGYAEWREAEAASLASEVETRLKYLQNPKDCDTAKKLVCSLNKGCGYGCQLHHATYCLIVAYATKRTMILSSKGWRYHKNGWEDLFLPLSDTCLSPAGSSRVGWPGRPDSQVIVLPIIDTLSPRPDYLPPAIPKDLAPRLIRLHGNPIVWWIGQMLRYLLRPQAATTEFLNKSKENLKFQKPIVGVHIRRTDKVGTEAAFHPIEEYMKHVNEWYDQQEYNGVEISRRRIYIATDDPRVITEARDKYPDYDVLGDPAVAKTAGMATRYTDNSLNGIMLDIHLLSLSDHLVCTFSSQVCRVAYELMQTYNADSVSHFTSLDDVYYYGGQNAHSAMAVIPHHSEKASELELKVGDRIAVAGNHWDGYSKGRNLRTNQVGLYPSFKVQDQVKVADFGSYEEVPKVS